jgi:ureidoacrylate peracid hydrolase
MKSGMRNIMTDRDELYEIAQMIAHKPILRGLRDKVAPHHTAIIVVDMQNDFVAKDGMMGKEGWNLTLAQEMAERLPGLLASARRAGVLVVFVHNIYSTGTNHYLSDVWMEQAARKRPGGYITIPGCEAMSWGADYYANLRPEVNDPVVVKHRYNAFLNTDLDTILRANGIRTTVFTGVSTNCCVESTAREAFMRDYYVVVVDDATASYSRELHQAALKTLDALFGEITSIAALTEIWNRTNNAPPDDVCSGEFGVPI